MALYVVQTDTSRHGIIVAKCTGDPTTGTNWLGQDLPLYTRSEIASIWSVEDSGDIHVAWQEVDGYVYYARFDCGTDAWINGGSPELVTDAGTDTNGYIASGEGGVSIGVRSDGDVIVLYTYQSATYTSVRYARLESGTWTTDQSVAGPLADIYAGVVVMGASDRAHFFFAAGSSATGYHRSLSSANGLDTLDSISIIVQVAAWHPFGRGVSYDDGGTQRVRVPVIDNATNLDSVQLDSGANPSITQGSAIQDSGTVNYYPCFAVETKEVWALWSDVSTDDIWSDSNNDDAGWGTDTEEQDAVTCTWISSAVYDRSGNKLGYFWSNNGAGTFDEKSLAAIVSCSAATLASSAQALTVTISQTISMATADASALAMLGSPVNIKDNDGMTAWKPAGTMAMREIGAADWNNVDNAKLEDGNASDTTISASGQTEYLQFTNHGFTTSDVPSGVLIVGVEIENKRAAEDNNEVWENWVRLRDSGGLTGDNKNNTDWYQLYGSGIAGERHSWRNSTLGGPSDDWNAGLTDSEVRASTFGYEISTSNDDTINSNTAEIDFGVIRVYWTYNQTISLQTADINALPIFVSPIYDNANTSMTPWKWGDTQANVDQGQADWVNMHLTELEDNDCAANPALGQNQTDLLRISNFGFTTGDIPSGALIEGIEFIHKRRANSSTNLWTSFLRFRDSGGYATGTKQDTDWWPNTTIAEWSGVTGSASDDWNNIGLDDADIRSTSFAIDIGVFNEDTTTWNAEIDHVLVRVHWTLNQTVYMQEATLASSAEALTVTVDVQMAAVTLTGSAQSLKVYRSLNLSTATFTDNQGYLGPFYVNSTLYLIGLCGQAPYTDEVGIWEFTGTDPTSDSHWDSRHKFLESTSPSCLWGCVDGTDIHVALATENGDIQHSIFDTTTDKWTTENNLVYDASDAPSSTLRVQNSIAVRSDGDVIILFTGNDGTKDEVYYILDEGSGFGSPVDVSGQSADVSLAGVIVMGASDRAHFIYYNFTDASFHHRSLSSANVLDTEQTFSTDGSGSPLISRGDSYVSSGTNVKVTYQDLPVSYDLRSLRLVSGADPTLNTDDTGDDADITNTDLTAVLAVNDTTSYLLYVDGTDKDIYLVTQEHGESWGTPVELKDATTGNRITGEIYDRGNGDVFGYWVEEAGLRYYYEYILPTKIQLNAVTLTGSPQALTVGGELQVSLSAVTLDSAEQALTVIPGEATVSLTAITLASSAEALTVTISQTVSLSAVTLAGSAEALTVIPGAVAVSLQSATLTASGQALTVVVDQSIAMGEATLVASPQTLAVVAGEVSIPLNAISLNGTPQSLTVEVDQIVSLSAITLTASPQNLAVIPGTVTVSMQAVSLASSAQTLNVAVDQTVSITAITLTGSPQALAVIAGAVTIPLTEATLVSSAQTLSVLVDETIALQAVTLDSSEQALTVIADVTISLQEITLTASPQTVAVAAGTVVLAQPATLVSSAQALFVSRDIVMQAVTLTASGQTLSVVVDQTIAMSEAILIGSAEALAVIPGAATVSLNAITLASSAQALNVAVDQTISITAITLTASLQAVGVIAGVVTVPMQAVSLAGSAQTLTLVYDQTVSLQAITLTGSAQSLAVIPGAASISITAITLTASAETLAVIPGEATVALGEITLTASAQTLTVLVAGAVPMVAITLSGSAETLTVVAVAPGAIGLAVWGIEGAPAVGIIISMGAITLTASPQALTVIAPVTIQLSAVTLISSAETLTVIPGTVTVSLSAATLVSSAQALTVLPGAVTVALSAATLVSSAETLAITVDQTIALSAITLVSSAEALTVFVGTAIPMSAVTLTVSAQALTVIADQTIAFGAITLVGSAEALVVVSGAVVIPITAVTLASSAEALTVVVTTVIPITAITLSASPQALTLITGATSVSLSEITLVSTASTLAVIVGAITVQAGSITLVASPQALAVLGKIYLGAITLSASPQSFTIIAIGVVPMGYATLVAEAVSMRWVGLIYAIMVLTLPDRDFDLTLDYERDFSLRLEDRDFNLTLDRERDFYLVAEDRDVYLTLDVERE